MDGPANANRSISLLALSFLGIGALSVLGGVALIVAGVAGGGVLALSGEVGSGAGVAALMLISGVAVALSGVPEIAAWVGLAGRKPWGRTLALFLCAMSLAAFPLGTALGAWGLYVLLSTNGVRAFGIERTWGTDIAAVALGWMFRPSRDRERDDGFFDDRRRRRRNRRYRARRGGGCGCLGLVLLLVGLGMFTTCGHAFTSCAGSMTGDPRRFDHVSPMNHARAIYDDVRTDGRYDGTTFERHDVVTPVAPVAPIAPIAPIAPRETEPRGLSPGNAPVAPSSKKQVYIYTDKNDVPAIVDDINKVPDDRKHTLRTP